MADRYELIVGGERHDRLFLFNPRNGEVWQRRDDLGVSPSHWTPSTAALEIPE